MSKSIAVVAGAQSPLYAFASALVGKATGNAVAVAAAAGASGIALGEAPAVAGAHSVVTKAAAKPDLYKDAKVAFVRAVLPTRGADQLQLRDVVDVYPASGIDCSAEIAEVKASFALTAATAVREAKAQGNKITVHVKKASKHARVNELFEEAVTLAAEGSGVEVAYMSSAELNNALVVNPDALGVVAAPDTQAAEVSEQMFSGLMGGVARTYIGENVNVAAGHSETSVANAVAESLRAMGLSGEAKKIDAAVAKAAPSVGGKNILAAL